MMIIENFKEKHEDKSFITMIITLYVLWKKTLKFIPRAEQRFWMPYLFLQCLSKWGPLLYQKIKFFPFQEK